MTINIPTGKIGDGLKNGHVSVPIILSCAISLIQLWLPAWYAAHQVQIHETQRILFAYGIIASSTTGPTPPPAPPQIH